MIVVNFFSCPGGGKSTLATSVFSKLKWDKINTELVLEVAKNKIYEENKSALDLQFPIGFEQIYNQMIYVNKTDVIVCDSPFILSCIYNKNYSHLTIGFVKQFKKYYNLNYFIVNSNDFYTEQGRIHTQEESIELNKEIEKFLKDNNIVCKKIKFEKASVDYVCKDVMEALTYQNKVDTIKQEGC